MVTFSELFERFEWREIRNCPGRFCARNISPSTSVSELLSIPEEPVPRYFAGAKDGVIIVPLEGGGIISFKRRDGTYLHTLNTEAGFIRKQKDLGILGGEAT